MTLYQDFLFVTADTELSSSLTAVCQREKWTASFVTTSDAAFETFDKARFRVILIDIDDVSLRGMQVIEWMRARSVFSVMGAFARVLPLNELAGVLSLGVGEILGVNETADAELLVRKLRQVLATFTALKLSQVYECHAADGKRLAWVGSTSVMRHALDRALGCSESRAPVLIRGATGSGMKLLARMIAAKAGMGEEAWFQPEQIHGDAQAETFAHVMNPLCANGRGTLCVSEIGKLSLKLQESLVELLCGRGLTENGQRVFPDIKLVATTSADPELLVREGKLRADLLLLLGREVLSVPPLCERKDDIPLLAADFLEHDFFDGRVRYFSDDALVALQSHDWPGNVKELKTLVRQVAVSAGAAMIKAKDLPAMILEKGFYVPGTREEDWREKPYIDAKRIALNKFNREYISDLLSRSHNNLTVAAEKAGMDRSNFKKIIKKFLPDDEEF